MNCHDATELVFAERDRPLAADQCQLLDAHVARCSECARIRTGLARSAAAWRETATALVVPDPEREWQHVRRRLRAAEIAPDTSPRARWPTLAAWTGLPLAAAAAIAVWVWAPDRAASPGNAATLAAVAPANAEFVEATDEAASTVVYVDQESGWLIVWASSPESSVRS